MARRREILVRSAPKLPGLDAATARELASISSELRQDRERAMYGDDVQKLPPQRLFDDTAAAGALIGTEKVMAVCERLMNVA